VTKKISMAPTRPADQAANRFVKSDQHWLAELNEFSVNLEICEQKAAEIFRGLGISADESTGLSHQVPCGQFEFQWWHADFIEMCHRIATTWLLAHPQPTGGPRETTATVATESRKVTKAKRNNEEEPQPDGPVAPDGFRHAGKVYSPLARGPFRALSVAWELDGRCANKDDLSETLYGDREETLNQSTLRDLRGKLNDFFRDHKIPYKATVRGYSITIKDGDPPTTRPPKRAEPARREKTRR
jgi:hypothetical protein